MTRKERTNVSGICVNDKMRVGVGLVGVYGVASRVLNGQNLVLK
jgi:hypothetical protein